MVILHVKNGDESQFLYETSVNTSIDDIITDVTAIYNGRLKISRICYEVEELAKHGTLFPPDILNLYEEQVTELGLKDEWGEICLPSGGWTFNKDPVGRRNGKQPNEHMVTVLTKTVEEARGIASKKQVAANICLTQKKIQEALDILRGAIMIVYPMNLPPHDVIRMELENNEDLEGTQASKEVIDVTTATLWFSGKELHRGKLLKEFIGSNEKSKIVVKLGKLGEGAPSREPVISEEERKEMMSRHFRRQEELKRLEEAEDDDDLNATWADGHHLKRAFHGLNTVSWRPK